MAFPHLITGNPVFLMSDPPHLVKKLRNSWEKSGNMKLRSSANKRIYTRRMFLNPNGPTAMRATRFQDQGLLQGPTMDAICWDVLTATVDAAIQLAFAATTNNTAAVAEVAEDTGIAIANGAATDTNAKTSDSETKDTDSVGIKSKANGLILWEDGKTIHWRANSGYAIRATPNIPSICFNLTSAMRMKVNLAAKPLSAEMADIIKLQDGYRGEHHESLALFCYMCHALFQTLNRDRPEDGVHPGHPALDDLHEALVFFEHWVLEGESIIYTPAELLGETASISRKCFYDLRLTCMSFEAFVLHYSNDTDRRVIPGLCNQDPLEQFFAYTRSKHGDNRSANGPGAQRAARNMAFAKTVKYT